MASIDHVSDSEGSDVVELVQTPRKKENTGELSMPGSALSHRFRGLPQEPTKEQPRVRSSTSEEKRIEIMVKGPARPWEYQPFVKDTVDSVLAEVDQPGGEIWYRIEYEDGRREDVSLGDLLDLRNGTNALDFYNKSDTAMAHPRPDRSSTEPSASSSTGKRTRTKTQRPGFIASTQISSSEDDLSEDQTTKKRRLGKGRISLLSNNSNRASSRLSSRPSTAAHDDGSDSESDVPRKSALRSSNRTSGRQTRSTNNAATLKSTHKSSKNIEVDELADSQAESDGSEAVFYQPKKKSQGRSESKGKRGRPRRNVSESDVSSERPEPTRKSGRERVVKNMKERDMDEEIYADDVSANQAPKTISIREVFQPLEKKGAFVVVHSRECDVCHGVGNVTNNGKGSSPLIRCQGCSSAIHEACLSFRSSREHMVTKVGYENFVLQCRRCIGIASKKDPSAPKLDTCQECKEPGPSCAPFSSKKSSKQEEKLRAENNGDDPITEVSTDLVNNAYNVLFRCKTCRRAWHFEHLPSLDDESDTPEDLEELRSLRLKEYSHWECKDCVEVPGKVDALVAWRPVDRESYMKGDTVDMFREDEKEYLIKWVDKSYFKCTWMPGGWVWGVTVTVMRNSFFSRDEGANRLPKYSFDEAVREEFLRVEIILDVSYNGYRPRSEKSDKSHINKVEEVLVKFQGLGYDETVWDEPPTPDDGDRYDDFVAAYNEYLAGRYFKQQTSAVLKQRIESFQSMNFKKDVFFKDQPSAMVGGEMMDYQKEGMNWLLFNFHQKKNVILADEMGLGKTIQVIAFIAALVKHNPKCWPFLVVTPNSTCPNWRREIKKWAPGIRVVSYYGGKAAMDMAMKYELFPEGCSDMRAHVVVTSYDAPVKNPGFFKKIKWAGMIVDEGQRLKNDQNLLYIALKSLKTPFQALLTGTPMQNNKRELFNLLQFCDPTFNAAELDEKYQVLTKESLSEIHDLIRPFFLRRTKLEVLKFLPAMAQVIVPVTMSVLQKKLYKSILEKNPELIKSLIGQTTELGPKDRTNLNNILMQLRKCICHPFVYNPAIEEKSNDEQAMNRNLIDASSKFQLLEIMLPKLRERGHRVLLFSQFLDNLTLIEDFFNALDLPFQRLDGKLSAMEKQRRIDEFNAPDSKLFAFLLSTRAGGVGINLATADTVIIMDPDFNPHQDIQAISRAHRIGQKNKVLIFQLMTKDSAEEKIVQIGRKKMALDQAVIEALDSPDDAGVDVVSILTHGAKALFDDDDRNDIKYNSASVDKLLDRTQVENTEMGKDKSTESQFSFARVWANDKGALTDDVGDPDAVEAGPDPQFWDSILEERDRAAKAAKAKEVADFGRGRRVRKVVTYGPGANGDDPGDENLTPRKKGGKRRAQGDSESDVDFHGAGDSEGDDESEGIPEQVDLQELALQSQPERSRSKLLKQQEVDHTVTQYPPILPPPRPHKQRPVPPERILRANGNGNTQQPEYSIHSHPAAYRTPDRHGDYEPGRSPPRLRNSSGGAESYTGDGALQHEGGYAGFARGPAPQRQTGYGMAMQVPQLPNTEIHTAGAKVQPDGKRLGADGIWRYPGPPRGPVGQPCDRCGYKHITVSRKCPRQASSVGIRLMMDAMRDTPMTEEEEIDYKEILKASLHRRTIEENQAKQAAKTTTRATAKAAQLSLG